MASQAPPGVGSGIDKDRSDYTIYSGGSDVGRIYETRGRPQSLRGFWSMTVTGPMTRFFLPKAPAPPCGRFAAGFYVNQSTSSSFAHAFQASRIVQPLSKRPRPAPPPHLLRSA